ncbi:MAG: hypothetical protein CW716_12090 [Candidatus Bathyarchaeum sp.]|nr:MAG: hypothetical protein CW716_12090 [Candidatus Bathyarchaeum sp.]
MKTKIVIALITVVALGVLATGIVLAHNPTPATNYPTGPYDPDTGYYGWGRGCYGYNQEYYRYPPTQDPDTTEQPQPPVPPQPTIPTDPNYYYPRGYGRGCWGW